MEQLRSFIYFIGVLSVLVLVHEWGHFIMAKLCGMHVEDFSLFFGKRLIKIGEKNGTEYNIRCIPMGGFVKIAGMEPDDISNGAPIFQRKTAAQKTFQKTMAGLTPEALAAVQFDNVSDRVVQAVNEAVGGDGHLSGEGRRELRQMLDSTALNADEHQYIEAILTAQAAPPDPNGYNQKPLWQRAATIFAGPFMSLLFGYVLFCGMGVTTGLPYDERMENVISSVSAGTPADKAGLKKGDRIVQIDAAPISDGRMMVDLIHKNAGNLLHLTIERNGQRKVIPVTPETKTADYLENGKKVSRTQGQIGFMPKVNFLWQKYSVKGAIGRGSEMTRNELEGIQHTLTSLTAARQNIGGPVAIAGEISEQSKNGMRNVVLLGATLSISLGIVNLLPIPILDGGHLMLLAFEGIRRRKLSSREVQGAQMVGLALIGTIFAFVMFNDISRMFHK